MKQLLLAITFIIHLNTLPAQTNYLRNLDKLVTINIKEQPVIEVLDKMSKIGGFYFSFNGALINQDSIVSLKYVNTPVRDVLDELFKYKIDYKEKGNYIILRYAGNQLFIEPENVAAEKGQFTISGFVVDKCTGTKIKQASVYEKNLLQSTLSDNNGYFTLKFKGDYHQAILTASKEYYRDTSTIFLADINVRPEGYKEPKREFASNTLGSINDLGIGRFFLSSKQKFQSLNIASFLANAPFQASLIPGLSSQGMMSSQIVNKGSLNLLGGYTAGVNGVEVAGLFNVTKGDVLKFQAAGLFNAIGGSLKGMQFSGLLNNVKNDVNGFQAAGLVNNVLGNQIGVQVAGVSNMVLKNFNGGQIAGISNVVKNTLKGVQIAGIANYAKYVRGVQIGLINSSYQNDGYSIGLLNLVRTGYNKIFISSNETINTNLGVKMGNTKLYNILFAGYNISQSEKIATLGLGFGHDFMINQNISMTAEATSQYLYLGNWEYANFLNRVQLNFQYQIIKGVSAFIGPAYNVYISNTNPSHNVTGYKKNIPPDNRQYFSKNLKGWPGYNLGLIIL